MGSMLQTTDSRLEPGDVILTDTQLQATAPTQTLQKRATCHKKIKGKEIKRNFRGVCKQFSSRLYRLAVSIFMLS